MQKEYKTNHNWIGKVIPLELWKKFKLDHKNKCIKHNPESVRENETQKILYDFEIKMYHLISARRPDPVIVNKRKRTCRIVDIGEGATPFPGLLHFILETNLILLSIKQGGIK